MLDTWRTGRDKLQMAIDVLEEKLKGGRRMRNSAQQLIAAAAVATIAGSALGAAALCSGQEGWDACVRRLSPLVGGGWIIKPCVCEAERDKQKEKDRQPFYIAAAFAGFWAAGNLALAIWHRYNSD